MRLFRQPQRDDWASVFSKIEVELRAALPRDASAMNSHSHLPATPTIQISWGELIDKITILEIKEQRLGTREAAEKARYQLALVMVRCPRCPYASKRSDRPQDAIEISQ
jgi:hypothetical protein